MRGVLICSIVAILIIGFCSPVPSMWTETQAESFVRFAEGGVRVTSVPGSAMSGSGDPIGVPGGVSLMLGMKFEFTNSKGEKRQAEFCNGHPDFWYISLATDKTVGYLVKFEVAKDELSDPHTENSWWVSHMGLERHLRVARD